MRILIACLAAAVFGTGAQAKDLPEAEFVLSGALNPAIQDGQIVPIFVHLKTGGDRMDWTFVTVFSPDKFSCEMNEKCEQRVQSLSHIVDWGADGRLTVVEEIRAEGDGLTIDRADVDEAVIYPAISALVDGGILEIGETGGTLSRKTRRRTQEVTLYPGDLDFIDTVMMVGIGFEQSVARMNHCELRQLARIVQSPEKSAAEADVLAALEFWRAERKAQNDLRRMEDQGEDGTTPELRQMRARLSFIALARATATKALSEATAAGTPISDEDLLAEARDAVEAIRDLLGPEFALMESLVFDTHSADFLAGIHYQARFIQKMQEGADPIAALCADVTLGG